MANGLRYLKQSVVLVMPTRKDPESDQGVIQTDIENDIENDRE